MNNDEYTQLYIYIHTTETDMKEFMPTVNKFHKGQTHGVHPTSATSAFATSTTRAQKLFLQRIAGGCRMFVMWCP